MNQFEKDIVKFEKDIYRYALSLTKDEDDAKDLVQEVFLRAIIKQDLYKENTNLGAWLTTMTKNVFINLYRDKKKYASKKTIDFEELMKFVSQKQVAYNLGVSNLSIETIYKIFKEIDDSNIEMFLLMTKGFKYKEIAERFDIPLGTVKFKLSITKKEIRDKLIKLGYENSKI